MKDIATKENGDVYFGEDIVFKNTTDYHKKNVLLMKPGDLKHAPEVGVHIRNYINTNQKETLLRAIRKNFLKIGLDVVSLRIESGILKEQSEYEES